MRVLYTILFYLCLPLILLRMLWRGLRAPAYFHRWNERFGLGLKLKNTQPIIWVHAVSVGEVEATRPIISALKTQYPQHQLLITTMTPTGSERVRQHYGDSVLHCYLPYDIPFAVKRFLDATQPVFGLIMETELWPNLIATCHKKNIPLVLANARMSARSARGYQKLAKLTRTTIQKLTLIAAQTNEDRDRFKQLGADITKVHAIGNLKYEITLPASLLEQAEAMRAMWGNRPVCIAASTHEGEEEIILNASKQVRAQFPDLLLIIVPRHPERFDRAAALSQRAGFRIVRRSEKRLCSSDVQVLIVDSMGELPLFYGTSDIAIIGGSLVPHGGHNLLEPAALSRPIITGPHYFNFNEITKQFLNAGAAIEVQNSQQLAQKIIELLNNPQQRAEMGEAGLRLITLSQGATKRLLNLIKRHVKYAEN